MFLNMNVVISIENNNNWKYMIVKKTFNHKILIENDENEFAYLIAYFDQSWYFKIKNLCMMFA